jgi:hypothetical protein
MLIGLGIGETLGNVGGIVKRAEDARAV